MNDAYSYMAMLNYPYPTSFLKPLPAWPANESCGPLYSANINSSDKDLFTALRQSIETYYSYNQTKCNDIYGDSSSDEDMSGWDVLACADEAMPMSTDGVRDMFWKEDFDYQTYSEYCEYLYGVRPDYEFTLKFFGGITDKDYLSSSRIVFTNGNLDPWSGGSPIKTLREDLPACYIIDGAHHLDLRPPHPMDPVGVTQCRAQVLGYLKKWIGQVREERVRMEEGSVEM
jgi:lysosomal Pro-X carboxypeptidase